MIDFLLDTNKDDIILGPSRRSNSLAIQFNIGQKTNKLKIQFFVESVTRPKHKVNALNIKFNIKPKEDDYLNKSYLLSTYVKIMKIMKSNKLCYD